MSDPSDSNTAFVTIVGTMPPIKGVSAYNKQLLSELVKLIPLKFIGFKSLYPSVLFPGGSSKEENDPIFTPVNDPNLVKKEYISWYNPISWLRAGLDIKTPIVHIHWWTYYLFPIFFTITAIAKIRKIYVITTVHNVVGHETSWLDNRLSQIIYLLSDKLILHTDKNAEQIKNRFQISDKKISVIPRGIYNFYITGSISKKQARKSFGYNKSDFVFLYFGHIRKYKGIDILLRAFQKVSEGHPNAKLLLAGKPWTDWHNFSQIIGHDPSSRLKINSYLDFIPTQEVEKFFMASDVLVLPYREFESQSGPGNIALAADLPMIVSDVGGLPDLVKNPLMSVPSGNINALASAMTELMSNESLYKTAKKDTMLIKSTRGWDKTAEETLLEYKTALVKLKANS